MIAIDVARIELKPSGPPASQLGSDHRRAAAEEGIEDQAIALRAILDGIGDERHRLDGRMHGERFVASCAEAVDAWIGPDVGAVASVLAELEVVDMRCRSDLEDGDEFVLRAVEGAHAGVGLGPDDIDS